MIGFLKRPQMILVLVLLVVFVTIIVIRQKSGFNDTLSGPITEIPPKQFEPINKKHGEHPPLANPTVKEEIGLAMAYPQGAGASMSDSDSNAFTPTNPGPLLTDYSIPEAYGESSLSDPIGNNGASEGARVIRLVNAGNQKGFKPTDEYEKKSGLATVAYSNKLSTNKINTPVVYHDTFIPEDHMVLQSSPGQETDISNCEKTYPHVVKYGNFCITEGDIPYGQVVDGKVNPRLVSRWESYTGLYDRQQALKPIDGLLYPHLNVL